MPSFVLVQNIDQPIDVPARLELCTSFACRLRGLMFRPDLDRDSGLLLQMPRESRLDSSIHMFFVPFTIAAVWVNSELQVVDRVLAKPWHPAYVPARSARYVMEIHPDRLDQYQVGHRVQFDYA